MKAYITPDTKHKDALWLIVERGQKSPEVEKIMGMFRDEDTSENVAYPILADEVKAILQACLDYSNLITQKEMIAKFLKNN